MSSREIVLGRVRAALATAPPVAAVSRDYRRRRLETAAAVLDVFEERLHDYGAVTRRTGPSGVRATIAAVLAEQVAGRRRVVVPEGVPLEWVASADPVVDDGTLDPLFLDRVDAVVTGCAVAIAETGTIILDASPDQGRRVLTLIPDLHVCVVRADQVVGTVPEAVTRCVPQRPLTWISGPSATSDIELNRVEGVHGPRRLVAVLVLPG
jgi:L-lactate dehydrogenase complex protein LldG